MSTSSSHSRSLWSGYLFALTATVIWSGNFIVARGLADELAPAILAFFRWFIGLALLLPFALPGLRREWGEIRRHLRHLLLTSFLGVTIFNTMLYAAGKHTSATNLSLLAVFSPVFMVVLARIFLNDPITPRRLAGLILAISGVVLLTSGGDPGVLASLELNFGDLLMLAATVVFAGYSILLRWKPATITPVSYLAATFLFGLLMLLPWTAWDLWLHPPGVPSLQTMGALLYLGVGPALMSYFSWTRAIETIGPVRAGMVYYTVPLFSGLEAWILLGENISWVHGAAGVLIISGISVATMRK